MSFLSILLFVSAFYFVHGRPDSTATAASAASAASSSETTSDDSMSSEQYGQYSDELNGFIQAMSLAIDNFMLPIMSDLSDEKKDLAKTMAINGFGGVYNMMIIMYKNLDNSPENDDQDFSLDRSNIMVEFESLVPLYDDSALMPTIPLPKTGSSEETGASSEADPTPDTD